MNSLSVNFRGISFLSTVKQWLLHAQMYCTSYALADENTSLRQNRTLEAEAGLFPAVSMLWGDSPKGSPFPFSLCFCQVIQSPFKPSRLCLSAVVFVRENCVCQWPPLPSWPQLNRRRKLSQEELKIHSSLRFFFGFFSHLWLQQRWGATAREDTYSGESAWDQLKPLDWFQGVAGGGNKTNNKSKKTLIRIFRNIFWALSEGLTGLLTKN